MHWDWLVLPVKVVMISLLKVGVVCDLVLWVLLCFTLERAYHEKAIARTRKRLGRLKRSNPPYSQRKLHRITSLNDKIVRHERAIWRNRHFS